LNAREKIIYVWWEKRREYERELESVREKKGVWEQRKEYG
jgi:hypothetical protein